MSPDVQRLQTPLSVERVERLHSGDLVSLSGVIYAARDAAHRRMCESLEQGEGLPFDPTDQVIYYVGPTPPKPGEVIGSAGPTTAGRMDCYSVPLLDRGLRGMIGKGRRNAEVREAIQSNRCIYFGAIEGTAALLGRCIQVAEVIAYEDLGTEAVRRLKVVDFPLVVINDAHGGDLYDEGRKRYRRTNSQRA